MKTFRFSVIASSSIVVEAEDREAAEKKAFHLAGLRLKRTGFVVEEAEEDTEPEDA
jgi:hypothetical protein